MAQEEKQNYFVTEWSRGGPGHFASLEPGNQGSIGKHYSAPE